MKGVVKRILLSRGYGFITSEEDGLTYYFHARWVEPLTDFDRLSEGKPVIFTPATGGSKGNGLQAEKVRIAA